MPLCRNHTQKKYTGKENSPLGKGYHAHGEKLGKRMKGKDGKMYVVVKWGEGKRWQVHHTKKVSPSRRKVSSPRRKGKEQKIKSPRGLSAKGNYLTFQKNVDGNYVLEYNDTRKGYTTVIYTPEHNLEIDQPPFYFSVIKGKRVDSESIKTLNRSDMEYLAQMAKDLERGNFTSNIYETSGDEENERKMIKEFVKDFSDIGRVIPTFMDPEFFKEGGLLPYE